MLAAWLKDGHTAHIFALHGPSMQMQPRVAFVPNDVKLLEYIIVPANCATLKIASDFAAQAAQVADAALMSTR